MPAGGAAKSALLCGRNTSGSNSIGALPRYGLKSRWGIHTRWTLQVPVSVQKIKLSLKILIFLQTL